LDRLVQGSGEDVFNVDLNIVGVQELIDFIKLVGSFSELLDLGDRIDTLNALLFDVLKERAFLETASGIDEGGLFSFLMELDFTFAFDGELSGQFGGSFDPVLLLFVYLNAFLVEVGLFGGDVGF